jgi:alanine dehydrogenase
MGGFRAQTQLKEKAVITLGVLRETKVAERRVALVPDDVRQLQQVGARVLVQDMAGTGSGVSNQEYVDAGATIADSAAALIDRSEVIVKVKEPALTEIERLRPGQLFMSFLHLAGLPELIAPLIRSGATALGYETIASDGQHPVLRPMSEIAGTLALQVGEHYLEVTSGGKGVLLPCIHGEKAGKVVIIGSGVVGEACGRLAYRLGVRVVFVDINQARLEQLAALYPEASFRTLDPDRLADELEDADLLVGAVYLTGARAPRVISCQQIGHMAPGSVAVDVAIDQGGCFETSHPTTHESPVYTDCGVVHYCVQNMPSMAPRTGSMALSHALLPYVETVARLGVERALREAPALAGAVNVRAGCLVLPALQEL